jgi:hypothetical protein
MRPGTGSEDGALYIDHFPILLTFFQVTCQVFDLENIGDNDVYILVVTANL